MPSLASGSAAAGPSRVVRFEGHTALRHRLVLALVSGRPVRIDRIRPDDEDPGIRDYEVSFLRLLERISNGTTVEINYTGTSVYLAPGTLIGGAHTHTCPASRSIGWFLEPLLALAPFCKRELTITLLGITTDGRDASVDTLRTSLLPHLGLFLDSPEGLELRITKRGHPPLGGGEVVFRCPAVKKLKANFDFTSVGRAIKIRGIAHSVRVSPQISNRLVSAARAVLNRYIPDIYIYADVYRGDESGRSPGYALTLLSTSTSSVLVSAEATSCVDPDEARAADRTPEDVGELAASLLLAELARGGCIDRGAERFVLTLMVLGGEDLRRCKFGGPLDASTLQHLRDLRDFFGVAFKIRPAPSTIPDRDGTTSEIILSCVGIGHVNVAAKTG